MASRARPAFSPVIAADRIMTLAEFEYASATVESRAELVNGWMLVHDAPKPRHSMVAMAFAEAILLYWHRRFPGGERPGRLLVECGVHVQRNPDTLRVADVAYVVGPPVHFDPDEFPQVAPELVLEVVSPSNRAGALRQKIGQWQRGGCQQVWVAHPRKRTLTLHIGPTIAVLGEHDVLEGSPFFPGLNLSVDSLFR
jgi:Uma2 family endonuclease